MTIPRINLIEFEESQGTKRSSIAKQTDQICKETGFLSITNHGISEEVISNQWNIISRFFKMSRENKSMVAVPYEGYPYGWIAPNRENLGSSVDKNSLPDLKESFNGGPLIIPNNIKDENAYKFCYQPTLWPNLPGFKKAWTEYYQEMEKLALRIMKLLAEALGLNPHFFDKFFDIPISALRALYYPETGDNKLNNQKRAGSHTDYGSLTILLPEPEVGGLEIYNKGKWIPVLCQKDSFIVNLGDLMEIWTSGRWKSTLHRVEAYPNQPPRKSIAFFHQPDWNSYILPIFGTNTHHKVQSGPYLMQRFLEANKN